MQYKEIHALDFFMIQMPLVLLLFFTLNSIASMSKKQENSVSYYHVNPYYL